MVSTTTEPKNNNKQNRCTTLDKRPDSIVKLNLAVEILKNNDCFQFLYIKVYGNEDIEKWYWCRGRELAHSASVRLHALANVCPAVRRQFSQIESSKFAKT